jgi:triphosphoribosyl-dephospho-CoA synthetase
MSETSNQETKAAEDLAVELLTTSQHMTGGKTEALRLLDEIKRTWTHGLARTLEQHGFDDDAVNWLDTYADAWHVAPDGAVTTTA